MTLPLVEIAVLGLAELLDWLTPEINPTGADRPSGPALESVAVLVELEGAVLWLQRTSGL